MRHALYLRATAWLLLLVAVLCSAFWFTPQVSARSLATVVVTDCTETGLRTAINTAPSGATITFQCPTNPTTITLGSTLELTTTNLTLDGSGQSVTLSGGGSAGVLVIDNGVQFTLKALTIANGNVSVPGATPAGGGIFNNGGTVTISNSTIANNSASGLGTSGGIENFGGTVTISNSTIANNSAFGGGAGIENFGGTMTISNSTIANNTAFGGGGGGIVNNGTVTISNSTIANNSGNNAGGIENSRTVNIDASIVANNTATNGVGAGNCAGFPLTDQGYNLENGTDCGFSGATDQQNTPPQFQGGLQDNGGPTQTIALQQGSPASDRIPVASCPGTDQRGVSRPDTGESTCDVGAYEFVDPADNDLGLTNVPANSTVDATSPQGTTVIYSAPTATDESGDTSSASVNCTPVSGSTFAIGTTTVTCTATDSDDTNSPVSASFTVTVNGAATQIRNLIATIQSFHLPGNDKDSFISQLQAVQADLSANNTTQACSDLTGFINHSQAQSGKELTVSQANQLITDATRIQAVLGC